VDVRYAAGELRYRLEDSWDRALDGLFAVLRIVLWPFLFVISVICWVFDLALYIGDELRPLREEFMPQGIVSSFLLCGGAGVGLFWLFGPNDLINGIAVFSAIAGGFCGIFSIGGAISGLYDYFISDRGAGGTEREVMWWQVSTGFFGVYAGFSLGYYLPWLFGMSYQ
jgi:hypothetical protein